jgi:hypothetical protein
MSVSWIALAQVFLEFGEPSGQVPPQPAFGKEPEAGRGVPADPGRIHELAHAPAATERDEASDEHPTQQGKDVPQLPGQPVEIPVPHVAHLQLGGRTGDHYHRLRGDDWKPTPKYIGGTA